MGKEPNNSAGRRGLIFSDDVYSITDKSELQLKKVLEKKKISKDAFDQERLNMFVGDVEKHGTVGAVALDIAGNIAAATSTGGIRIFE